MTTPPAFELLAEPIRQYLWGEQWESLRDVQERAIPVIAPGDRDVVIGAATAEGKTEAAFLPALTHLLQGDGKGLIIYISPLKALINDQFGRLERLCENLDIPVYPWHGDITQTSKRRFSQRPNGVLLITPESLEALFCNRGTTVLSFFSTTKFVIVDELHAFIGTERGKQLQSLLHRLERVIGRTIPRVGLSATLGDMSLAGAFLRPKGDPVIVESDAKTLNLMLLIKGYEEKLASKNGDEDPPEIAPKEIAEHLFTSMRGTNNLVFPNSRREVERYAHMLREMCEKANIVNQFWPHHGNLSKEIRAETEQALKQKDATATAICTSTLELGIDIGTVRSVAQIGPPPSVASLRQRTGRSGRRPGEPTILRSYQIETALDDRSDLATQLRLNTFRTLATILLMTERWFEPPMTSGMHLSTLVQQFMSLIAQHGGIQASAAYGLLCSPGAPFEGLSKANFAALLRHMASLDLIMQDSSGLLLHGRVGERIVNHYTFYAAFTSDEEYRIVTSGKTLGSLPVSQMLASGQRILFGGRTWLVDEVDDVQKVIAVSATKGGSPPLFSGGGGRVHTRVRERMRSLYQGKHEVNFADACARGFIEQGRNSYHRLELDDRIVLDQGTHVLVLTWLGDAGNEALACLLNARGAEASAVELGVEVRKVPGGVDEVMDRIRNVASRPITHVGELLARASNLQREKWDWALPASLLQESYASLYLDIDEAHAWARSILDPQLTT